MPKKNKKYAKKKRKSRFGRTMIMFLLTAVIVFSALSVTVLFPIAKITVKGDSIYKNEEILNISGIDVGDNIFLLGSKAAKRIETKLPYISKVKFKRELPDKLTIQVYPAKEERCYYNGKSYVITDKNNKVLKITTAHQQNLMLISADFDKSIKTAEKLSLKKQEQENIINEILNAPALKNYKINAIDVRDNIDICIKLEDRFNVKLGDYAQIDGKLAHLEAMIEKIDPNATGEINLKSWSQEKTEGYFTAKSIENNQETNQITE